MSADHDERICDVVNEMYALLAWIMIDFNLVIQFVNLRHRWLANYTNCILLWKLEESNET